MSRLTRLLGSLGLGRPELRAWALYDWAAAGFSTTVIAAVLPIYFHDVAAVELPENLRTAYWGYTSGIALAIVAVLSPILGVLADMIGAKKKLIAAFMAAGALSTLLLAGVGHGDWRLAAFLFFLGNIGYAGGNVFYDALLPAITRPGEVNRVSTAGYALGYIGGGVLLALNLAWIMMPATFGFADKGVAVRASFVSVAVWWGAFTIPLLRRIPEPPVARAFTGHPAREALTRLGATFREIRQYREVLLFLVSYWFFTDGIGTIIKMATTYGREVGIGSNHLIGALLLVQFVGIPATFAFGWLADRIGPKIAVQLTLVVYAGICVLGFYMREAWQFWALAVLVALVQGGSQALSRALYATMIPKARATEFFAFVSVSARFAGILGPLLFGIVSQVAGESRLSILFLISFFVIGSILLHFVDVEKGRAVAEAADREALSRPA